MWGYNKGVWNMCVRERKTGRDYLENDNGESDYMCPKCPFKEECHKETAGKNLNDFLK